MPQQLQAGKGDDWTGKSDPRERKKLQDRINQRISRLSYFLMTTEIAATNPPTHKGQRKRARAVPYPAPSARDHCTDISPTSRHSTTFDPNTLLQLHDNGLPFIDDLSSFTACRPDSEETQQLINRFSAWISQRYLQGCLETETLPSLVQFNTTRSFVANAQTLGYTSWLMSPSARSHFSPADHLNKSLSNSLPASLRPTALQCSVPHHPWIDLLPVSELRDNLLRQGETTYDAQQLCRDMRGFQAVSSGYGGVIVWGDPWDPEGWEVTEAFARKWPWVVRGNRSLFQSSNHWRAKRHESALDFQCHMVNNLGEHPRVQEIREDV
jgi:hypothetical protein